MKLEEKPFKRDSLINTPNLKTIYYAPIENPFCSSLPDDETSRKLFETLVLTPLKSFGIKEKEQEVLEFYETHPWRLPIKHAHRDIHRIRKDYYFIFHAYYQFNSDKTAGLDIHQLWRIDFARFNPVAIANLMGIILDEDLSIGERGIVRDVALSSFHKTLEYTATENIPRREAHTFADALRTDLHDYAVYRLRDYGFTIRDPPESQSIALRR